ncbi:Kinesin-related protein 3 [Hondaea fermentalgiana]|uniref:Kinesin-related protein 3 n=1 Tax=Hondaea fermentalgiana TaxID=2315210 RepID=A0A2R5GHZ7_9STRA|nr:Kinesin-related protein 3 [Hondaea fermentalgiana]|eukprot:GBG29348.1 Kinesin-related protein 3 [Hondaea fermentalgiana]
MAEAEAAPDRDLDHDDEGRGEAERRERSSTAASTPRARRRGSEGAASPGGGGGGNASTNVRVCCRFRPANKVEEAQGAERAVSFGEDAASVTLHEGIAKEDATFTFDRVFQESSQQDEVYDYCAKPLVKDVLDGYNCTIFAYGQTGSGKTHTMMGPSGGKMGPGNDGEDLRGVVPRIAEDIFDTMSGADADTEFMIKVSFVEIYMERIRDLLNPGARNQNLRVRDVRGRGVVIEGAEEVYVSSAKELLKVAAKGNASRAIASTRMNQDSSRSHSVFMITVSQRKTQSTLLSRTGKLFLVDLAGSEMVKKTGATSGVLEEAKTINRSLSALGNVIKALVEGAKHVPYRDSKLTRCLQDSLGGNSKTSLIITCSGFKYNAVETLSTLRFGTRAKRIKNKPTVNQEFSVAEYKAMVARSRDSLLMMVKYARSLEASLGIDVAQSPVREVEGDQSAFTISAKGLESVLQRESFELNSIPTCSDDSLAKTRKSHGSQPHGPGKHAAKQEQEQMQVQQERAAREAGLVHPAEGCPEDTRYPPSPLEQSSPQPETEGFEGDSQLVRRAEEALTKALEKVDSLQMKADEAQAEADIANDALEGLRARNRELEDELAASAKAQADLVQRVAKLELFQQQAEFKEKETQLTLRGLKTENKVLKQHLGGGDDDAFFQSGHDDRTLLDDVESLDEQSAPAHSWDINNGEEGGKTANEGEGVEAKASSPECDKKRGRKSRRASRELRRRSTSLRDIKSSMTSQEALLKSDLMHITEKYIQLRLEMLEAQELLAASNNADLSDITDTLRTEREHNLELNKQIRKQSAKLQVAQQNEVLARLKLQNRESQIGFLEAALHDYQASFKSHVEDYQEHVDKLQTELAAYKLAFDALDHSDDEEEDDACDEREEKIEGTLGSEKSAAGGGSKPRVIKPVRGRGGRGAPTRDQAHRTTKEAAQKMVPSNAGLDTPPRLAPVTPPPAAGPASSSSKGASSSASPAGWFMGAMNRLTPIPRPKSVPSIIQRDNVPGQKHMID